MKVSLLVFLAGSSTSRGRIQRAQQKCKSYDIKTQSSRWREQQKLGFHVKTVTTNRQENFNVELVDYVVNETRPFSTVEAESFRHLFFAANPDIKVFGRSKLMSEIKTKNLLKARKFVPTTNSEFSTTIPQWKKFFWNSTHLSTAPEQSSEFSI